MSEKHRQPIHAKIAMCAMYIMLLCLLIVGVQCAPSTTKVGPSIVNCAEDELPPEFQVHRKRERIIFLSDIDKSPSTGRIRAFDMSQNIIEDIFLDFPKNQGLPILSPSEIYFVYRERIREEKLQSVFGDRLVVYYQPVIRAIETQSELTVPMEIESGDLLDWSPDGKCLVVISNPRSEMGLYHLADGRYETWELPRQIKFAAGSLSPNGRWLAGLCGQEVCVMKVNGEEVYRVSANTGLMSVDGFSWSPDSRYLLIRDGDWEISYLDANLGWAKQPLIDTTNCRPNCNDFRLPMISDWSPDGTKLAGEIFWPRHRVFIIIEFPSGNYDFPSVDFRHPIWSPDGRQLADTKTSKEAGLLPAGIYKMRPDGENWELIKQVEQGEVTYALFWTSGE
jgi:Tol biopolymer transport system component